MLHTAYQDRSDILTRKDEPAMSKWKCKVCGYIYEGETLPEDFICPLCKQPASAIEKIEEAPAKGTSKYAGTEVKCDGEEYMVVRQSDILAVVE